MCTTPFLPCKNCRHDPVRRYRFGPTPKHGASLTVSSKLYLNIGAHPNDWKGVRPDVPVPAHRAMEEAMRIIR